MSPKSNVLGCHVEVHAANVSYLGALPLFFTTRQSKILGQAVGLSSLCVTMDVQIPLLSSMRP